MNTSFRIDAPLDLPAGYAFAGRHCGLKDRPSDFDLSLICSERDAHLVGVFTQNHIPGEPVKLAKERLPSVQHRALLINSRYSNVATGDEGRRRALSLCEQLATELQCDPEQVLISSTGIIGRQYPEGVIEAALPALVESKAKSSESVWDAARGIMTTDTHPKALSCEVEGVKILVMVKGSGMICPDMATMLSFIVTDAELSLESMQGMLQRVVNRSFNNLSIDFDTSTSDSCFLMANGAAGKVDELIFEEALASLCLQASEILVRDGEGVDTLIDCRVKGGLDAKMVRSVASSIINSPLVKTMVTGADPNWGRLAMAIGKVKDDRLAGVQPSIWIDAQVVLKEGQPQDHDLEVMSQRMRDNDTVLIEVDLHLGHESVQFLGANLTKEYVSINAEYTT